MGGVEHAFPSKRRLLVSSYGSGVCGSVGLRLSLDNEIKEKCALWNQHEVALISVRVLAEHDLLDPLGMKKGLFFHGLDIALRPIVWIGRTLAHSRNRSERKGGR